MAREHAQYPLERWSDPEWRALSVEAQWLATALAGQRVTNTAGLTPLIPRRWCLLAAGLTIGRIELALAELVVAGRAVVDSDEDLVWLRHYMADHAVFANPNMLRAALADVRGCESDLIRAAVVDLLIQYPVDTAGFVIGGPRLATRATIPAAIRLAVYERDDWTCQDCGRRIPPTADEHWTGKAAPFDEAGWLELDHRDPWSHGGPDTADNLRALCSRCNRVRGARLLVDPRGSS